MNTGVSPTNYSQIDNFDDLRSYHNNLRTSNDYQNSNSFVDIALDWSINAGRIVAGQNPVLDPTHPHTSQAIELAQQGAVAAAVAATAKGSGVGTAISVGIVSAEGVHAAINLAGGHHATEYANALDVLDAAVKGNVKLTQDAYDVLAQTLKAGTFVDKVPIIDTQLRSAATQSGVNSTTLDAINDHCFVKDTPISMWPTDSSVKPREDGNYDEELVLSKVWQKPISEISDSDLVVSYDKDGRICPGPVTRTMRNRVKHVLDFWGTGVTPGHAYFCADGKFKGQHVPLLDILRTDGTIMKSDGTQIRAATGCEVGSIHDRLVHAVVGDKQPNGQIAIREQGQVRLGTRVILENGEQHCVLDILNANGAQISEDGYIRSGAGGAKVPLSWTFSEQLPKPEDYILRRSKVTLEEIYAAGEWEQIGPRLPAPDGSKASPQLRKAMPVGNKKPLATADGMRQPTRALNRKQRKAMEAKQRKAAKAGKRLVS